MAPLLAILLAAPPAIAVQDLVHPEGAEGEAALLTGVFASNLRAKGLRVLTSDEITSVLGLERQRQLLGCTDVSCTAELAGALGVDAITITRLGRVGAQQLAISKVVSAKSGEVLAEATETVSRPEQLSGALTHLAWRLAVALQPRWPTVTPGPEPSLDGGGRRLNLVGLGIAGAGLAVAAIGVGLRLKAEGTLVDLRAATTLDRANSLRQQGNLEQGFAVALWVTGGAALATGLVVMLLGVDAPSSALQLGLTPWGAFVSAPLP
jgi:hypothetical protein